MSFLPPWFRLKSVPGPIGDGGSYPCSCACLAAQKTVLIVYAHQSVGSFNEAICEVTVKELTKQGYNVIVSDLYAMDFKASATRNDIIGDLTFSLSLSLSLQITVGKTRKKYNLMKTTF